MFSVSFSSRSRRAWAAALLGLFLVATPPAARAAEVEHVVSRGQNLVGIARRYRVTVDAIREVNGLKPWEQLHPGQRLVIPERGKEAEAARRAAALRKDAEKKDADKKGAADKKSAEKKDADKKGAAGRKDDPRADSKARGKKGDDDGARAGHEKGFARKPKRPGLVRMVRGTEQVELQLLTRSGRLNPKALPKLSHLLRSPAGSIAIDPRLASLIGMVSDHFGGRTIRVVSGYRPYSPAQYTPHSNHNIGRAMDFSIEGVPNTVVRDFCRSFRNAGVGYYPNSSFVHLDVRSAKTYWVDYSRPGERPRYHASAPAPASAEAADDVAHVTSADAESGSDETQVRPAESPEKTPGNQSIPGPAQKAGD